MGWDRSGRRVIVAVHCTLALMLAACSSGGGAADEAADPGQVLAESAVAMAEVDTAAFTLAQSGADVAIDDGGQLRFLEAQGRIARPSSADAVVTVDALGFTTEVGAVAIEGTVWFTNPLTGQWAEAPAAFTFDPTVLFDPDVGLAALLAESAGTAEIVGLDEPTIRGGDGPGAWPAGPPGDGPWHRVRTMVAAERVATLTGGLVSASTSVDLWIDAESSRLAELRFEIPIDDQASQWRMTVTDYDVEVEIDPPVTAGAGS